MRCAVRLGPRESVLSEFRVISKNNPRRQPTFPSTLRSQGAEGGDPSDVDVARAGPQECKRHPNMMAITGKADAWPTVWKGVPSR